MKSIVAMAFFAIAAALPVSAATVTVTGTVGNGTAWSNPAPDSSSGSFFLDVTGTVIGLYKDVYAGTLQANKGKFNAVRYFDPDGVTVNPGSLTYNLAGAANSVFSLIWGSIDADNKLTINYDDSTTEDVYGSDVLAADPSLTAATSNAYVWIKVANKSFSSVTLTTNPFTFEHAFNPTPIPVPAAGLLLVGALGALGVASRRRKAA